MFSLSEWTAHRANHYTGLCNSPNSLIFPVPFFRTSLKLTQRSKLPVSMAAGHTCIHGCGSYLYPWLRVIPVSMAAGHTCIHGCGSAPNGFQPPDSPSLSPATMGGSVLELRRARLAAAYSCSDDADIRESRIHPNSIPAVPSQAEISGERRQWPCVMLNNITFVNMSLVFTNAILVQRSHPTLFTIVHEKVAFGPKRWHLET